MRVEAIEIFNFPPESIFAVITNVLCHTDWVEGPIELMSLTDNPAKLGTLWEHKSDRLGRRLVTANECNIYEANRKFGWITGKPISSQTTLSLEPEKEATRLIWSVESEATGIARLAEPLLVKETKEAIGKSFRGLKAYLQAQA